MLLADLLPVPSSLCLLSAVVPPDDQPYHKHHIPSTPLSPGSAVPVHSPPTMQYDPPPVTRLIPENLLTAIPDIAHAIAAAATEANNNNYGPQPHQGATAIEAKSLFCSEAESSGDGEAILPERGNRTNLNRGPDDGLMSMASMNLQIDPRAPSITSSSSFAPNLPSSITASSFAPNLPSSCHQSSFINTTKSDTNLAMSSNNLAMPLQTAKPLTTTTTKSADFRVPLAIKIPNHKIRIPTNKGGKKMSTAQLCKPHAPGEGILAIARMPPNSDQKETNQHPPHIPPPSRHDHHQQHLCTQQQHLTKPQPLTIPNMASVQTDHGILNIISTCEPGSKVPTPPASHLTASSLTSMVSSFTGTVPTSSSSAYRGQAAAHTLTSSTSTAQPSAEQGGGKARRSRRKGANGKTRTCFTLNQVGAMEQRFEQQRYLTSVERREFAASIGLEDNNVKIWFQNRRSKRKKAQGEVSSTTGLTNRSSQAGTRRIAPAGPSPMPSGPLSHLYGMELDSSANAASHLVPYREVSGQLAQHNPATHMPTGSHHSMNNPPPLVNYPVCPMSMNNNVSLPMPISASGNASSYAMAMNTSSVASAHPGAPPGSFGHTIPPLISDFSQSRPAPSAMTSSAAPSLTSYGGSYPSIASSSAMSNAGYPYGHQPSLYDQHVNGAMLSGHGAQGLRSSSPFNFSYSPNYGVTGCHAQNSWTNAPTMPVPTPLLSNAQY